MAHRLLPLLALLAAAPARLPDHEEPLPDAAPERHRGRIDAPEPEGIAADDVDTVEPVQPLGDGEAPAPTDTVGDTSALPPEVSPAPEEPGEAGSPPDGAAAASAETQPEIAELRQQVAALQEHAAQVDALVQRGEEIEAEREARASTLDRTSEDLVEILVALQAGSFDLADELGAIEVRLSRIAQDAHDEGALQESRAIEGARVRVEAAGIALAQSDLYHARVDLAAALPLVRQAAVLAATSEQRRTLAP